ncbi:MAG: hemolysin family protein, partial [Thermoplasmata archaeon]|nr:hemolysin family protein [Thermoplasmata archaeon]
EIIARLLGPVIGLLTGLTHAVTGALGAEVSREAEISTEELKLIVERGGEQGVLEAEEGQMIHAVIELGERRVHEVMVPRTDIVGLEVDGTFEEAVDRIIAEGHSRLPVWERSVDRIVGILYAKDLLPFLKEASAEPPPIRALLRAPVFVPESITIDDLLHELQRRKVHLAVVLDEYGGTAGLVTIEDLLEEIVGEIQDEYDEEEPMVVRLDDERARIDGRASVDDLGEQWDDVDVDALLEDREEYDTLGGLLFHRIGGVPKPGDRIRVGELTLTVETTDGRRVGKVLAVRERSAADADSRPDDGER